MALREEQIETIMVNCNPETVSTDYDTSDRLYFEPLTEEDVLNSWNGNNPWVWCSNSADKHPETGALPVARRRERFSGTSPDAIDRSRGGPRRFRELLDKLGLRQAEAAWPIPSRRH